MFELNNYDDGRLYLRIETRKSVLEAVLRFISSHHKITIFVKKFHALHSYQSAAWPIRTTRNSSILFEIDSLSENSGKLFSRLLGCTTTVMLPRYRILRLGVMFTWIDNYKLSKNWEHTKNFGTGQRRQNNEKSGCMAMK